MNVVFDEEGALKLHYRLALGRSGLKIPKPRPALPEDELWKHLCFECFISDSEKPGYREFNFSPSSAWAAYEFNAYRQGGRRVSMANPKIDWQASQDESSLICRIDAAALPQGKQLRLGLCAVVEEQQDRLSYWALRHTAEKPDFHAQNCFVLELDRP